MTKDEGRAPAGELKIKREKLKMKGGAVAGGKLKVES